MQPTWNCPPEQAGTRIDVFVAAAADATRSAAQSWIESGRVTVNGVVPSKNYRLRTGDTVCVDVPDPAPYAVKPQAIALDIVYEDEDLLVVNKPKGMVVHPAAGNWDGTLVNALLAHCGDSLSGINGVMRPGIVHRIDKDTSGLLVVAKNDAAQIALSGQLSERSMEKHYRAMVEGRMREQSGLVNAPIARSKNDRKKMAVDPDGRESLTEWTVLAEGNGCTLLDVHILTGRTHQIRVHMKHIGHPVCGDPIYGHPKGIRVPRLMLHAYSLTFTHPATGERMTFTAPVPEKFCRGLRSGGIVAEENV